MSTVGMRQASVRATPSHGRLVMVRSPRVAIAPTLATTMTAANGRHCRAARNRPTLLRWRGRQAPMRRTAIAVSLIAALAATPALADPVADFYKGKQLKFIIRSNVGGTYDLYARLLARHM